MPPLPPPPDLEAALTQFRGWGFVVEHYLFKPSSPVTFATHEAAAKAGLEIAIHEAQQPPSLWRVGPDRWNTDTAKRAMLISPAQFMGGCFDWAVRKPLFSFPGASRLHAYDYEMDELMRGQPWGMSSDLAYGYAYAVFDPPYSLYGFSARKSQDRSPKVIGTAFLHLCDALFGDLETLEIYSWPTDCSNYFDAGHEWWGSFFWTVYAPSKNWIVTIIATSTD